MHSRTLTMNHLACGNILNTKHNCTSILP